MIKILFFIDVFRAGGRERRLLELIKGLKKTSNFECEIVLTEKEVHYKELLKTDIKIYYIERKFISKDPWLFYLFYNICKNSKPDIIHVWGNMPAFYAIPAKVFLGIPMINSQISDAPRLKKGELIYSKLNFLFSNLIISNSKAGLEAYKAPKFKSKVIYNGFDFNRLNNLTEPLTVKREFNINTKTIIGMVASFSTKKDYLTYIKSANVILKDNDDITFLCVGDNVDDSDTNYLDLISTENKEKIKFLGKQNNVESIMNICDIGILTTFTEGISNSLMEFMALAKPIIVSEGGGTKELVLDNETGFIIRTKSECDLIEKIEFLLKNKEISIQFGKNGKKRILDEFNIDKMISEFIVEYKRLYIK
jgi:glycosyltransferase involved in cell wall biosynthesis